MGECRVSINTNKIEIKQLSVAKNGTASSNTGVRFYYGPVTFARRTWVRRITVSRNLALHRKAVHVIEGNSTSSHQNSTPAISDDQEDREH